MGPEDKLKRDHLVAGMLPGIAASTGGSATAATTVNAARTEMANNMMLNHSQAALIKMLAKGNKAKEKRLDIAACASRQCADGVNKSDPDYQKLKKWQDEGSKPEYMAERDQLAAAMSNGEQVFPSY